MATRLWIAGAFALAACAGAAAACGDSYGEAPREDVDGGAGIADAGPDDGSPFDAQDAALPVNRCAEVPEAGAPPPVCNGDYGSSASSPCTVDRQVCYTGTCQATCSNAVSGTCTLAPGHPGPSCEPDVGGGSGRCGVACVDGGCPMGRVCDTGIGRVGDVCIAPLPNGALFATPPAGAVAQRATSCEDLATDACSGGVGYTLALSFPSTSAPLLAAMCVCGAPPGSSCNVNEDCADLHCNADGRCGLALGEPCPPTPSAQLTSCRSGKCGEECACSPGCTTDSDCGSDVSGVVCNEDRACVPGCRTANGNGCPPGQTCSSKNDVAIGKCIKNSLSAGHDRKGP